MLNNSQHIKDWWFLKHAIANIYVDRCGIFILRTNVVVSGCALPFYFYICTSIKKCAGRSLPCLIYNNRHFIFKWLPVKRPCDPGCHGREKQIFFFLITKNKYLLISAIMLFYIVEMCLCEVIWSVEWFFFFYIVT